MAGLIGWPLAGVGVALAGSCMSHVATPLESSVGASSVKEYSKSLERALWLRIIIQKDLSPTITLLHEWLQKPHTHDPPKAE